MKIIEDYNKYYKPLRLKDNFPPGMFIEDGKPEERKAFGMIETIEKLILEGVARNTLIQKFSLLQLAPRIVNEYDVKEDCGLDIDDFSNFYKYLLRVLIPDWYHSFTDTLSENQAEIYLKNYLGSHESWGTARGIADLVRSMLENDADRHIKVEVKLNTKERIEIEPQITTTLGNQMSKLGVDTLLGRRVNCRPRHLDIYIGPLFYITLEKLQQSGWADDVKPSAMLTRLVELAIPYYFKPGIHILLATQGFTAGKSVIGKDRLGVAFTMSD